MPGMAPMSFVSVFWLVYLGVVLSFFADSGQVFGGVCLRRFKTVLDTLRHSSQLPLLGIGELTIKPLRQCP